MDEALLIFRVEIWVGIKAITQMVWLYLLVPLIAIPLLLRFAFKLRDNVFKLVCMPVILLYTYCWSQYIFPKVTGLL